MRVRFAVDVGVDVQSYVQAGEKLDQVTQALNAILGEQGEFDIREFQTRHRHVREYSKEDMMAMTDSPMMAMENRGEI